MLHTDARHFAADAQRIRARLVQDLTDRGARMIDATIRSQRAWSRRFAFCDHLIGFGAGLRDVLLSWGIPDGAIFTNDTPVGGYFVRRKYWDFTVRDVSGRAHVLIENTRFRPRDSLSTRCYNLLGHLSDLHFTGRRAFTGLVFVCDALDGRLTPLISRRNRTALERFNRTCRQTGLLDASTYIEITPDAATEPSNALTLERFLCTLHRKLCRLPETIWTG